MLSVIMHRCAILITLLTVSQVVCLAPCPSVTPLPEQLRLCLCVHVSRQSQRLPCLITGPRLRRASYNNRRRFSRHLPCASPHCWGPGWLGRGRAPGTSSGGGCRRSWGFGCLAGPGVKMTSKSWKWRRFSVTCLSFSIHPSIHPISILASFQGSGPLQGRVTTWTGGQFITWPNRDKQPFALSLSHTHT